VQTLLSSLGIASRIYASGTGAASAFSLHHPGWRRAQLPVGTRLRPAIAGDGIDHFAALIGFGLPSKADRLARVAAAAKYRKVRTTTLVSREDDGVAVTYNPDRAEEPLVPGAGPRRLELLGVYAPGQLGCNLASLNLLKFLAADGHFDVAAFRHAVEIVFLAQEIIVGNSSYPTERITPERQGLPPARARATPTWGRC
jgi:hypothetical protein